MKLDKTSGGWVSYPIIPMGKPRMTQRDRWKKRPIVLRYHKFKDSCREHSVALTDSISVMFLIQMPKSWSKKKRLKMDGEPHKKTPDIDNLIKALMDAVLPQDSHVWKIKASKFWSKDGGIHVWVNDE